MLDSRLSLLAEYSNWLQPTVSKVTAKYYLADIRQHLVWLIREGLEVELVICADLERYVIALGAKAIASDTNSAPYASSTIARKVSALRNFYTVLHVQGQIASNPASQLRRPPAKPKRAALQQSAEAMLPLLPATEVPSVRHIRDLAILSLSAHEQLRIGEIARLNVSDVDLKAGMVRVARRPTRKAMLFLSQTTSQLLSRWVAARRLVASGRDEAVFISLHWTSGRSTPGKRISTRGLSQILRANQTLRRI